MKITVAEFLKAKGIDESHSQSQSQLCITVNLLFGMLHEFENTLQAEDFKFVKKCNEDNVYYLYDFKKDEVIGCYTSANPYNLSTPVDPEIKKEETIAEKNPRTPEGAIGLNSSSDPIQNNASEYVQDGMGNTMRKDLVSNKPSKHNIVEGEINPDDLPSSEKVLEKKKRGPKPGSIRKAKKEDIPQNENIKLPGDDNIMKLEDFTPLTHLFYAKPYLLTMAINILAENFHDGLSTPLMQIAKLPKESFCNIKYFGAGCRNSLFMFFDKIGIPFAQGTLSPGEFEDILNNKI
jgi:hypothetical protein